MKLRLFALTMVLIGILVFAGLPHIAGPIRAELIRELISESKPAWSSNGLMLARANAGRVFIYDLNDYIYRSPGNKKPRLIKRLTAPGVNGMSWSETDKLLLLRVSTFDIVDPYMLMDLGTGRGRMINIDGRVIHYLFWSGNKSLTAIVSRAGQTQLETVKISLARGRKTGTDGLLGAAVFRYKPKKVSDLNLTVSDTHNLLFKDVIQKRFVIAYRQDPEISGELIMLDAETGGVNSLNTKASDISLTDVGFGIIKTRSGLHRAALTGKRITLFSSPSFIDDKGNPLAPEKLSVSPSGKFLAFQNSDRKNPGVYVSPLP